MRTACTYAILLVAGLCLAAAPIAAQVAPAPTPTPTPSAEETKAKPAAPAVQTLFKRGFRMQTADGQHEFRVGGSVHLDSRAYWGDAIAPDSFDIRRARIDVQGIAFGFMDLRIQAAMEDNPYIRNAWLDIRSSDAFHLRLGQMKVPFSTEWVTQDNDVNFVERATSTPVYPFFDRGVILWGKVLDDRLVYSLGAFNGTGVDVDTNRGDIDDHKDVAVRLFTQPLALAADSKQGLYLVANATYGSQSVPTRRYETRGLEAADLESLLWRWRTEQVIGTNGRWTDQIAGTVDQRTRLGAEANYLHGPFTFSAEWLQTRYEGISIFHELWNGSTLVAQEPVLARDGDITVASVWASWFLTGEKKVIEDAGWRQPEPKSPCAPGEGGTGAWELVARLSVTKTDDVLFNQVRVYGFTADQLPSGAIPVGDGGSVRASVLEGAREAREVTLGVNWTLNRSLRFQLNLMSIWAPDFDEDGGGIVTGGNSASSDPRRNTQIERENSAALRVIFRI